MFNGHRVYVEDDEKVWGYSGNGYTTLWMYLMPLNCTLTNGQNDKYYVYFAIIKKSIRKKGKKNGSGLLVQWED